MLFCCGLQRRGGTAQARRLSREREIDEEKKNRRQDFVLLFFWCLPSPPFDPATCCSPTSDARDNPERRRRETKSWLYWLQWCYEKERNFQVSSAFFNYWENLPPSKETLKLSIGMCFSFFLKNIFNTTTNQSENPPTKKEERRVRVGRRDMIKSKKGADGKESLFLRVPER